ncbi:GNAT family N-acetyltransferase [Robiginitalea sp. SC105]|uniref:GNAT family N-acetyltransferase n=1 Tax=Robiginitalea sp. SC105 TaxID=2762332 RepID=UPI00163A627D|nr:GNAT family N-acetyltransferase [Robiginitalea sp. SC105]MBC2839060.1 GNAT family N-acetyltransferase [Robiginitalea sp. SC105]
MEIQIRPATREDLPALLELEQALIRDERPFDPTIRPDPVHYYNLPALLGDPDTRVVVATAGGQVVATGYATKKEPRHYLDHQAYAYFGFMYTRPAFRGRGINGRIMDDLRQWAVSRGLTEIRLTVYKGNEPAIRAYEKVGFSGHILEMRLRAEKDR